MNRPLSQSKSIILGVFVTGTLALAVWGLFRIAERSNRFHDGETLSVVVAEAADVEPGTPVRIRGVEAGRVTAVSYVGEGVQLELQIDPKYRPFLYADASAIIKSKGLFGTSVVDIAPGKPSAGPLAEPVLTSRSTPDLAEVTTKLNSIAGRVDGLLADIDAGKGTLPKLLKDDAIYNDLKTVATDTKKLVKNLDESVTSMRTDATKTLTKIDKSVDDIHGEVDGIKTFVRSGQEAVTAIKQDAEAIKSLPIVRSYVEDPVSILVRPDCDKDRVVWPTSELFEAGTSTLTAEGKTRLDEAAAWLRGQTQKGSEIVVAAFEDEKSKEVLPAAAKTLTKKQSETVVEFLRDRGVHKMGLFTRRKITPVGQGFDPSPIVEKEKLVPMRVELILFVPRS
ncbi:MlaD family protein [Zavarzinella formosa]|uniref:MlaD family protein n=1 Tax=Zavarzinella formosa TaxID=360055 RepID=UPI0003164662|nr:MlaD family protein [Zavarzinella formosa]